MIIWIIIESCVYLYTLYTQQFNILNIFIIDALIQSINFIYYWFGIITNKTKDKLTHNKYDTRLLELIDKTLDFEDNFFDYGYKISIIDKFVYFGLLLSSNYIWNLLTWFNMSLVNINSYILLFMSLPMIYINLCKSYYFIFIVNFIKNEFYKLCSTIVCKLTSLSINKFSKITFNSEPKISPQELENFFEDILDNTSNFLKFFRNLFILSVIHLFKNTDNKLFSTLISIIYNYQINGISLYSYTSAPNTMAEKKEELAKLISQRDWTTIFKIKYLNYFFELYEEKSDNSLMINFQDRLFQLSLFITKFMTLWSLNIIHPVLWILVMLFVNYDLLKNLYKRIAIAVSILIFYYSSFTAAFTAIFLDKLLLLIYYFGIYLSKKKIVAILNIKYNIKYTWIPIIIYFMFHYLIITIITSIIICICNKHYKFFSYRKPNIHEISSSFYLLHLEFYRIITYGIFL